MNPEDDEDDLLRDLGEVARERAREGRQGDEWDRLTEGALTPAEEAELAARAASDPEAAAALAAFRPLDDAFEDRLVGAIQQQRAREREQATTAPGSAGTVADARGGAEQEPRRLSAPTAPVQSVSPRRSRWRPSSAWGSGLAAAAVLAGVLVTRPGAPLPAFQGELGGGNRPDRGATGTAPPVYQLGSHFDLLLRPATQIESEVEVKCKIACALPGAPPAPARDWPPCGRAKSDSSGSLHITGTVGSDIPNEAGACDLWALVVRASYAGPLARLARPGLPDDDALLRLAPGASLHGRGWSALHLPEPLRFAANP
jgi:hypothetical protein